ncbi:MAG: LrgB family protein [Oscillospiraceae bacterium]|nr:LrgB family protein [Oscillospiraceae bacterium]
MNDFFENSVFFGVIISLVSYGIGVLLKKKFKSPLLNPLLISIIITIAVLLILGIDYSKYYEGAKYISYLLTPATVCLAIPLYEQVELLKHNFRAIITGIVSGVVTSLCTILALAIVFRFSHEEYVTFLPKSITTAIGMGVSEELGGYVSITAAVIIITGVIGNIFAELVFRMFRIHEPVAKGIALGSASHAIGTAKAMEIGEIEGAMSSLSIVVSGIITVAGASVFANFY